MEIEIFGAGGVSVSRCSVSERVFSGDFNEPLVHQVVTAYLASARSGTKAQKTRSEVRGGGAKPWRQKGTGRARAGSIRSPLWRKGGRTFAASPRSYHQKVNKKMYDGALRCVLSELLRQKRLRIVDQIFLPDHKTKSFLEFIRSFSLSNILVVDLELSDNLCLASRNLPGVSICSVRELNPALLIAFENVLMTERALKQLEGGLQ